RNAYQKTEQRPREVHLTLRRLPYILIGMLASGKGPKRNGTRLRNPERTRERLLQAAYREVYRSGFQSAGLDTILASSGVTKGALYHHFENKEALGYAIVEEVIAPDVHVKWLRPLQTSKDPVTTLIGIVQAESIRPEDVRRGCPLNNLAQEMSPLDEGFRKRLARVFDDWREGIAAALREGQARGMVRRDVEPVEAAGFLVAMVEGYASLAKNAQGANVPQEGKRNMIGWLQSLRAPGNRRRGSAHRV
ncbi:MAG: TetR/AcrR family transcriptional regulator, partial [Candidatus Acidiferrum sp.]